MLTAVQEAARFDDVEEQLRLLIDACPVALVAVAADGRIILANRETERIFGYRKAELVGHEVEMLLPDRLRDQHVLHRRDFQADPAERELGGERELLGRRKDGSEVPVEVGLRPIRTPEGMSVLSSIVDITERKRMEERFRATVESAPTAIVMIDAAGEITLVNAHMEQLFGYTREELLGQRVERLVPERFRAGHEEARAGLFKTPEARQMGVGRDLFGRRKDGREFPVEIGLSPVRTGEGLFVLAAIVDITERKLEEQQRAHHARQLKRSNDDLEQFAYVVSHDLKAPLRGIASVAEWLAADFADVVDEDARENLELMLERTDRLNRLIEGILEYSRVGRQQPNRKTIDTHQLVEDVIASIDTPEGITVRIDGRLPCVLYDETQLRQVFQNLINNAVTHLGKPQGAVAVCCAPQNGHWCFAVEDNGVGIAQQHRNRIFGLFQTLRPKDECHTTGVGLAIVKRIVERNGGDVTVTSAVGNGTQFQFTVM